MAEEVTHPVIYRQLMELAYEAAKNATRETTDPWWQLANKGDPGAVNWNHAAEQAKNWAAAAASATLGLRNLQAARVNVSRARRSEGEEHDELDSH